MQSFTNKLALLEELIAAEEDRTSVQALLENATIGQMYRNCRAELPKLIQLANSDLNEDLMMKIIAVTERMSELKNRVEGTQPNAQSDSPANEMVRLAASTEALNIEPVVFKELAPSKPTGAAVELKLFQSNDSVCWEVLQFASGRTVLRVMNITDQTVYSIKMVRPKRTVPLILFRMMKLSLRPLNL